MRIIKPIIPTAKRGGGKTSADVQDRDGGIVLLSTLLGLFPILRKLFADSAYQGPIFHSALDKILPLLQAEIVKRSDVAQGSVVLPKRWIVKRTIGWLNRCGRLTKHWENLNMTSPHFPFAGPSSASC